MKIALRALSFLLAGGAASAAAAQPQAPAFELTPHRAVYDMTLDDAESASGVTGVEGRLVFEVLGSRCDGYTVNMRFVSQVQSEESITVTDLRSSTFESGDGSEYRFVSRSKFDDRAADETDGSASRDGDEVSVDLDKPEDATFSIDGEVMFPTEHLREVIGSARQGERFVTARVYDGSDTGRKVYETTTVIGDPRSEEPSGPGADRLAELESWPITIAYFDTTDGTEETPSYEFSYDIFENGVSTRIGLDYGEFSLSGELAAIDFMEASPCEAD